MSRFRSITLTVLALVFAAACSQTAQELPTVQSLPTDAPVPATDVPPTDVLPTATAIRSRPTLPPTWTLVPTETMTPTPEEVFPTATFFNPPPSLPAGCATFAVDFAGNTTAFPLGTAPTVRWTSVEGAVRYRVKLIEVPSNRVIRDDIYVAETFFQFAPELFEEGKIYGWEVYPIDAAGDQMCFQVGEMLQSYKPLN